MSNPNYVKEGRFPKDGSDENNIVHDIIKRLAEGDSDWMQFGGYIGVRCHETPSSYRFVVAKIVHETEEKHV